MVYFSGEREISFHLAKAAYKNDGENNCAETSLVFDLYRAGRKNAEKSCQSCDQENKNFTWKKLQLACGGNSKHDNNQTNYFCEASKLA